MLILAILLAVGAEILRRQILAEFPAAQLTTDGARSSSSTASAGTGRENR
jgi:hypothetical protein